MERKKTPIVFLIAFVFVAYPSTVLFIETGVNVAFKQFATDAFYFLSIASHSLGKDFYTFDGQYATNGFHPLWTYYLTCLFGLVEGTSKMQIELTFITNIFFTSLGSAFFAAACFCVTGSMLLSLLATVPGMYCLLLPLNHVGSFSPWSFVNGMSSSFSIFSFGLLIYLLINRKLLYRDLSVKNCLIVGTLMSIVTLSRLDDVFIFIPFGVYLVLRGKTSGERLKTIIPFVIVPGVLIGSYLIYNFSYAGVFFPVSGATKNQGLEGFLRNIYFTLKTLVPYLHLVKIGNFYWSRESWSVMQMIVPATGAALWVLLARPHKINSTMEPSVYNRLVISLLSTYVIIKFAYNYMFVGAWQQGNWYYPISIMVFNLTVAASISKIIRWDALRNRMGNVFLLPFTRKAKIPIGAVIFGLSLLLIYHHANSYVDLYRKIQSGNKKFWLWRNHVQLELDSRFPGYGIVSFDDGIVSYCLKSKTMSGIGFALDPEASRLKQEGKLLEVAYRRGYRLITTLNYPILKTPPANEDELLAAIKEYKLLKNEDLDQWRFPEFYHEPLSGAFFIRFEPKDHNGNIPKIEN